jgi:hypothetical protein
MKTDNSTPQNTENPHLNVDESLENAKNEVQKLIDTLWEEAGQKSVVHTLNELLYCWLLSEHTDLSKTANQNTLFSTQRLINFIASLHEATQRVKHFETLKEVISHD